MACLTYNIFNKGKAVEPNNWKPFSINDQFNGHWMVTMSTVNIYCSFGIVQRDIRSTVDMTVLYDTPNSFSFSLQ